jgi:acetylglutamate kinase
MHILKIGGNELNDKDFLHGLAQTVANFPEPVVLVNGGGRAIADLQSKLGIPQVKVDGLRVTDEATLTIAEMVMSGQTNKLLVRALVMAGVNAVGLSGVDAGIFRCQKQNHPTADLGFVGEIVAVNAGILHTLLSHNTTPVLSPISLGYDGQRYNVNADTAATQLAAAMGADLLHFVSNVPGVMADGSVLPTLTPEKCEELINAGIITDGMIPKVRAATYAIQHGVPKARIVNLEGLGMENAGTYFTSV